MLFRLLLTMSLVGAWSQPAFGATLTRVPNTIEGGGTWHDSYGDEGTFVSKMRKILGTEEQCWPFSGIGCHETYETATLFHYTIELDDGRTEWFRWQTSVLGKIRHSPSSGSGAVAMKSNGDPEGAITIVDGYYTLTLLEEETELPMPNSITFTYKPRRTTINRQ